MKIAVMAEGSVGSEILDFLLSKHTRDVAAVVVLDECSPAYLEKFRPFLSGVRCLTWTDRAKLRDLELDLILLAWWPKILRADDLNLAPVILNLHPSLLPHCRGKDPNFWAIIENRPFGVTIHHVDSTIDGGAIAFQRAIPVNWESSGRSLYEMAQTEMVALFKESYSQLAEGVIPHVAQDLSVGSSHVRAELDTASVIELDVATTARDLLNKLRARTFPPFPACQFSDGDETYEVTVEIRRRSISAVPK